MNPDGFSYLGFLVHWHSSERSRARKFPTFLSWQRLVNLSIHVANRLSGWG